VGVDSLNSLASYSRLRRTALTDKYTQKFLLSPHGLFSSVFLDSSYNSMLTGYK
jgi:hypothetical protein